MKHKVTLSMIVGVLLIALLYCILDKDEFKEMWQTLFGLLALCVVCLIGWVNADSPVDNSRNTIDWELQQEEKVKQDEEDDFMRQMHKK